LAAAFHARVGLVEMPVEEFAGLVKTGTAGRSEAVVNKK
jgi:hypothetical protein